jgi:bifunctional non-homologous end joining protein LigD
MTIRVGRRNIAISHPDRVLFGAAGVTKADLARYYAEIGPVMVPHVRDRPLALEVYPAGVEGQGHYLKNARAHFPDWIARKRVRKRGGTVNHVLANDTATLVYLAGQNAVALHAWPSRQDQPRCPDRVIFDLDPPDGTPFAQVRAAARLIGDVLRDAGLVPFAMASGSRGIHVVVPIRPQAAFPTVFRRVKALAERVEAQDPKHLTTRFYKRHRENRIFIDTRRNAYAQHAVVPYSTRAKPGASVATPLRWEELSDRKLRPNGWDVHSAVERVRESGDPWQGMARRRRRLPA